MDDYIRLMAVNQLEWLNTQKNVFGDLNDELVRQKKWMSELNLSGRGSIAEADVGRTEVVSNMDPLVKPSRQTKVAKLSSKPTDDKLLKKSQGKNAVKSVRPLNVVEKKDSVKRSDIPSIKKTKEQEVQTVEVSCETAAVTQASGSATTTHQAHLPSPPIAQASAKPKPLKKQPPKKQPPKPSPDMDKREIENDKDLINTNFNRPISDKSKFGNKPRSAKERTADPPPPTDQVSKDNVKKERGYDVEAARNFMKMKQSKRQHQAEVEKQVKNKSKDRSEIKLKLQELRNKQLNILKTSTKRRKDVTSFQY